MNLDLEAVARRVGEALQKKGWQVATAESCTAGWVSKELVGIPGSSAWFDRGFVTYSDDAKQDMLGISPDTLREHGAVSEAITGEMAAGALARSSSQITLAVSGIAGPGGGTPEKPVGLVCFGWAVQGGAVTTDTRHFGGNRDAIRAQSVAYALEGLLKLF